MKLHYVPDTDSLYIDLNARSGADAREIADGLVGTSMRRDAPVSIDIQDASRNPDLSMLETHALPVRKD